MTLTDRPTWKVRADYWRGWRALGGWLTLDAHELAFQPHGLERVLGGNTPYRAALRDIVAVDVARRGAVPRKRLFVRTRDGDEARFLIPGVDDRVVVLRDALSRAGD